MSAYGVNSSNRDNVKPNQGNNPSNGVTQNEPVVTPKTVEDDGEKGENVFGNMISNTYSRDDIYNFYGSKIMINSEHGGNNWSFLGVIHTSRDWYESYKIDKLKGKAGLLFMHEYGHYLDSQYDPLKWYGYGMWSSMYTRNDSNASSNWIEIRANTMSYYYFHMPPVFLGNKHDYPIDVNSISQELKIKLYYHRKL